MLDKSEKKSLLHQLIQLAKIDNHVCETEYQFLIAIAVQMGLRPEEVEEMTKTDIPFTPPENEFDRMVQLHRLILLMNIDLKPNAKEVNFVKTIGMRLGLHPSAITDVLEIMNDYPNKLIPPDKLISIFRTYHN